VTDLLSLPIIQTLGLSLLHFLWQGSIVGILLFVVLCILQKPQHRYAVSCFTLLTLALLPIITFVNGYELPQQPQTLSEVNEVMTTLGPPNQEDIQTLTAAEQPQTTQSVLNKTRLTLYLPWLVLVWFTGALVFSMKLLLSFVTLQRFRSKGVRLADQGLQLKLLDFAKHLNVKQKITLLESKLVPVPVVLGWLRPVILLPASAVSGLAPKQLEMLLAHELSHVLRRDYLVNILQSVLESLLFYHPVVWWVSAQIRREREYCCDDIAVSLTGNARGYAQTLLNLAEMRVNLAPSANGGQLFTRISRLLQPLETEMRPSYWFAGLSVLGVLTALALTVVNVSAAQEDKAELWITVVGDVTFSSDYSEIESMASGAYIALEERTDSESKKIRARVVNANITETAILQPDNTLEMVISGPPETVTINTREKTMTGYMLVNGEVRSFDGAARTWYEQALKSSIPPFSSQFPLGNDYIARAQTYEDKANNRTVYFIHEPTHLENSFVTLAPAVWSTEPSQDEVLGVYRDNIRYETQRYSAGLLSHRSFAGYLDGLSASTDFPHELFPEVMASGKEIQDVNLQQQLSKIIKERSEKTEEDKQLAFVIADMSVDELSGTISQKASPDGKNRISGRISTNLGEPLAFGVVHLIKPQNAEVDPGAMVAQTGTNKVGEFSFAGMEIPSGDYEIWVENTDVFQSMPVPFSIKEQELEIYLRVIKNFVTLEPKPGATVSTTPTLSWEAVPGAVRYLVVVGDPETNEQVVYQMTDATSITTELPLDVKRKYSWSVGAYGKNGRQINAAYGDVFTTE
jgi:beta-lactamase regulating signal transducer with metallopeptidase domain